MKINNLNLIRNYNENDFANKKKSSHDNKWFESYINRTNQICLLVNIKEDLCNYYLDLLSHFHQNSIYPNNTDTTFSRTIHLTLTQFHITLLITPYFILNQSSLDKPNSHLTPSPLHPVQLTYFPKSSNHQDPLSGLSY